MLYSKQKLSQLTILILSIIFLFQCTALSANKKFSEKLPAEYDDMQGIIVAWLPMGSIPDRPITELSDEEIVTLNMESMSENMVTELFALKHDLAETDFDQIYTEGGNTLTDGRGRGFSTQAVVLNNPGLTTDNAINLFKDVLNLDEFISMPEELGVIDAINGQYGTMYPLPDLTLYLP